MNHARCLSIAFQTDKSPAEYAALAQLVERYDFDVVSVYCDAPFHPSYGPLLLMAPHLRRARLGPAAVSPFRIHPIDIAAETALLAGLARGGVYLGLARGAWLGDYGIQEPQQPVQALRETVEIVRGLLSGEFHGYEGKVYRIASHVRALYPLPQERIPILIGTWGKRLAGLAGEIADEVKVGGSANPDFSVRLVMGAVCVVDEDRKLARQKAREAVALYLPVVAPLDPTLQVEPELLERLQKLVEAGQAKEATGLISDGLLNRFAFAGNPDDLIAQAEGLFATGVGRIEFGTPHGLNAHTGIRLLGERVLPNLRAGG